ncbi:hypothetical protein BDZ94DRAFT_594006 [Collybia nuda]|uniref:Uncharacterized protein n=1 Tax=Collybia nuda TaxID=64659 RepID=A0A9P5Y5G1_9AGAR|nr:hypothetical protein BDZ94DRAFT_594006 [Collybia nuda]
MENPTENEGLTSEMVALLGRELKRIKAMNDSLEKEVTHLHQEKDAIEMSAKSDVARAEAAEHTVRFLEQQIEELNSRNKKLDAQLNEIWNPGPWQTAKKEEDKDILYPLITGKRDEEPVPNRLLDETRTSFEKPCLSCHDLQKAAEESANEYELLKARLAKSKGTAQRLRDERCALRRTCEDMQSNKTATDEKAEIATEIEALNESLEKVKGQLEKQREAKRSLRLRCDGLEEVRDVLLETNEGLKNRLEELEGTLTAYKGSEKSKTLPCNKENYSNNRAEEGIDNAEFQSFLGELQSPLERPGYRFLSPVYGKTQLSKLKLCHALKVTLNGLCDLKNPLYFPGRTRWLTPNLHALVFGPTFIRNSKENRWVKGTTLSSDHGTIGELFFEKDSKICYAGTYKCHYSTKWFPEGIAVSKDMWPELPGVVEAARSGLTSLSKNKGFDASTLLKLYEVGAIKLDFLVLECVGFNHVLYNKLLQEYIPETGSKRKPHREDNGKMDKKAKLTSTILED